MSKVTINLVDDRISEHFWMHEFMCNSDGDKLKTSPEFFFFVRTMLEEFRIWYNRPISPSSAYRTPEFNRTLKDASPNSQHLNALAIDVVFPKDERMTTKRKGEFLEHVREKWFEICDKYGITGGSGFYDWGFHIDAGNTATRRRWDYRGR